MNRYLLFLSFVFIIPHNNYAQQKLIPFLEREVTIQADKQSVESILDDISAQAGFIFSYSPDAINHEKKVTLHLSQKPVRYVLDQLLDNNIEYKVKSKYLILHKKKASKNNDQKIQGYVYDSRTGKKLTGTSIYDKTLMASAVTDQYGYFSINVPTNKPITCLQISKLGYTDTFLCKDILDRKIAAIEIDSKTIDTVQNKNFLSFLNFPKITPKWMIPKKIKINSLNINDSVLSTVQLSLLPMVSTNQLMGGNAVNKFSFNATIGYVQGVEYAEFGGIMNIDLGDVSYCQFAGFGNIVGQNVTGVQSAGTFNYAKSVNGVQYSGTLNIAKKNADCQVSGVANITGDNNIQMAGVINKVQQSNFQVAGVANIANKSKVQVAGILNITKQSNFQLSGVANTANESDCQVAGIFNKTNKSKNIQVASVINYAGDSCANQLAGMINYAKKTSKVQVASCINYSEKETKYQVAGLINIAGFVKKMQLGIINIADSCKGAPIGFLSFVKYGYHRWELSANEMFPVNIAFRTGVKKFHTYLATGYSTGNTKIPLWNYSYGIGTTFGKTDKLLFDIDLSATYIIDRKNMVFSNNLYQFYIGIDRKLTHKFSTAAGLTYNWLVTDTHNQNYKTGYSEIAPYSISNSTSGTGMNLKTWIGGKIALRFY
jgi:hypothetical protein